MSNSSSPITFERSLRFQRADGSEVNGKLVIGDLEWNEKRSKWACRWSIEPIHPECGEIYGEDPLDAFIRALDFLSILIRGSEDDGLKIWWKLPDDHVGITFPMTEGVKWRKVPPGYRGELPPGLI